MSHCDPVSKCADCGPGSKAPDILQRMGLDIDKTDFVVALAGNPNTGKSTVFNNLTGLHQHTGNWPGKTVSRAEGAFRFRGKNYKLVDLPGTYSLLSASTDEEIARDFILFGKPDVTIIVVDATSLERNLNLVLQILQITDKVIVCLNLMDEAKAHGIEIDIRSLSRELGVPVIPCVARQKKGMHELVKTAADIVEGSYTCKPRHLPMNIPGIKQALGTLTALLKKIFPGLPNNEWIALRLLSGDDTIRQSVGSGEIGMLTENQGNASHNKNETSREEVKRHE